MFTVTGADERGDEPIEATLGIDSTIGHDRADVVIHGWDPARATGLDDTIDPEEVEAMWPEAQQNWDGENLRTGVG